MPTENTQITLRVARPRRTLKEMLGADEQRLGIKVEFETDRLARVKEVWLEQPIDARWMVAYRIVAAGGPPRVGEVRVFPLETNWAKRPAGEWSGTWKGVGATAPRLGLTRAVLSRVRLHDVLTKTREIQQNIEKMYGSERVQELADRYGLPPSQPIPSAGPRKTGRGRPALSDDFYVQVAADYVAALKAHKPPVQTVAEQRGEPIARVRGWVHRARLRGLLVGTAQGKNYGELSDRAIVILEVMKRTRQKTRRGGRRRK